MKPVRISLLAFVLVALLQGCIFYPKRVEVYDQDCKITSHHMELKKVDADCGIGRQSDCLAVIATVAVTTAVISESIVVAGNTLYWLAKEGKCATTKQAS